MSPLLEELIKQAEQLTKEERLQLISRVAEGLSGGNAEAGANAPQSSNDDLPEGLLSAYSTPLLRNTESLAPNLSSKQYSITDFRGIGADLLNGVDATAWVRGLRDEWTERGGLKES